MDEQYEIYENARKYIQQKKRLYFHFILFVVGSIFLIVLNKLFNIDEILFKNWFIWVIVLWFFLFIVHTVNVFITNRFMGKNWEQKQLDRLVLKQKEKIDKLKKEIENNASGKIENE